MRILHIDNICSIPYEIVHELRRRGHDATLIAKVHPQQLKPDIAIETTDKNGNPISDRDANLKQFKVIRKNIKDYDIIHVHGGLGMPGFYYWLSKKMDKKKRVIIHFHGSDLRNNLNTSWAKAADKIFVSTPDLLECTDIAGCEKLIHIPNPINLANVKGEDIQKRKPLLDKDKIIISHMPTDRTIKGTKNIIKAVDKLKKKYNIELDLIEKVNVKTAQKRLSKSDICVDWVSKVYDIYGVVSVEAMAYGIPTICKYNEEYYKPPILKASIGNVDALIEKLIKDRKFYLEQSKKGKAYVKKTHDLEKIVTRLEKYYKEIL